MFDKALRYLTPIVVYGSAVFAIIVTAIITCLTFISEYDQGKMLLLVSGLVIGTAVAVWNAYDYRDKIGRYE